MSTVAGPDLLSQRALNRALLDRQLLLRRHRMPAADAVEHLVGLQAQSPNPPYIGLWTRLKGFCPDELGQLLLDRSAVRTTLMRGTIHLVSARDCLRLRPVLQRFLERSVWANATYGRAHLEGMDLDALLEEGRALVEEEPRSVAALRELLGPRWPDRDPSALAFAVRILLPAVFVPPRGVWGRSGPVAFTTADAWLGEPVCDKGSVEDLVLRYLAAFGPAAPADAQTWSGLTRLAEVFASLAPQLRVFRDERGRELYDLPDAPRPDPDTPAPVRLLAEFDNLTLSHADRTRVIADEHRRVIASRNGMVPGMVLVDGFVRGMWRLAKERREVRLRVETFERLSPRDRSAVEQEATALLGLLAADTQRAEVELR
jgi:Winged helix DNA-binding domain